MDMVSYRPDSAVPATMAVGSGLRTTDADEMPIIRRYLRIALRRGRVILASIIGCMVIGVIVTLTMTPRYTAATTIEISRESDRITNIEGVERESGAADQEFYQTQYGLLRSRLLSERVASVLRLADDQKFFRMFGKTSSAPAFQQTDGRYPAAGRPERIRVAGEILRRNLNISPTRLSRLVEVSFTSPDPIFSSKVANAWADSFIQTNLERKVQATAYGRNLLERQLAKFKERLDESQRQLVVYAAEQQIINLPSQAGGVGNKTSERSIVVDDLASLNDALSKAIADRIQLEARYKEAGRAGASTEALANQTIGNLRQRRAELLADYQRLMTQFQPDYPAAKAIQAQITQLDTSIGREETRVSRSLQADFRSAVERERALLAKVNELKTSYLDLRRRSIQYNIYQQEVDTNRALYDGLLQRFKEIGVAGGVGVNNVSIVDPADIPQKPSSPRVMLNLIIAALAGIGLGAGLAFAFEQVDEAIADPGELERRLGLPLLGFVPKVAGDQPLEALLDRKSDLVDAYLAIQTNLSFTTAHGVPRTFAVTSTRPGEGKSTSSLSLATTLARVHRKVILIDGDMRSPSVHGLVGIANTRGLSNFLAGEDDIDSMTIRIEDLGFSALPAGPVPPNAAELLTTGRMAILLERLLQVYDHVVIDSPPVMGLADAPLIASLVEGVVYVVEAQGARSGTIRTALDRLMTANAHVFGGILTKFEARRANYGYGYGYEYSYGYGRNEQIEAKGA